MLWGLLTILAPLTVTLPGLQSCLDRLFCLQVIFRADLGAFGVGSLGVEVAGACHGVLWTPHASWHRGLSIQGAGDRAGRKRGVGLVT